MNTPYEATEKTSQNKRIVVVGMVALDMIAKSCSQFRPGTSNIGQVSISAGGVGHNMARSLRLLGEDLLILSVVGEDPAAQFLVHDLESVGLDCSGITRLPNVKTAVYHATHDQTGEMIAAINDMSAIDELTPTLLKTYLERYARDTILIVFDANITEECISEVCHFAHVHQIPVWFNPTSIYKAIKVVTAKVLDKITFMSPNMAEINVLAQALGHGTEREEGIHYEAYRSVNTEECISLLLNSGVKHVLLTKGDQGLIMATQENRISLPALKVDVVNVTGAGDSLASGVIYQVTQRLKSGGKAEIIERDLKFGLECARTALECNAAVNLRIKTLTDNSV